MASLRAPTPIVLIASYCCMALMVAMVFVAQQSWQLGVELLPATNGQIAVYDGDHKLLGLVGAADDIEFDGEDQTVSERADRLTAQYIPSGSLDEQAALYARHSRLAAMAAAGPIEMVLPGGVVATLSPHLRSITELGFDFWALLFSGTASFLVGVWVWALRPRDWGARMFVLSGAGLAVSAFSAALFGTGGVAADGALLWLMSALNMVGAQICGGALMAQGASYPRALVRPRYLLLIPATIVPPLAATQLGWLPVYAIFVVMLIEFIILIVLMGLQWRLARTDPLGRAALRWIGLSTALGSSGFVIVNVAPTLLGRPVAASDGVAFLLLFVIYGGTALGVGRYRLFDLDRWAYRIVLAIAGSLALLVVDALLVIGLRFQAPQALGLSLAFIGLIYLPLRSVLLGRLAGPAAMSPSQVLEAADAVRFTSQPELRRQQWRALLEKLFDPLEITTVSEPVAAPTVRLDGLELLVPAAAGEMPLLLRYPSKGRTLFSDPQLRLVGQLVQLMQRAETARDGYARGVAEERSRIARDLHDDVSGRLLTSLHRPDSGLIREDVRTAMADLRTIMRGLAGEHLPAHRLLANLRHEASTRLEAAGISLNWPVDLQSEANPLLEYSRYKNLTSAHREVITNILRHAGASHVEVESVCDNERICLAIEDDGVGRAAENGAEKAGGNGLENIRRRLEEIGGSVTLLDRPRGLRVELIMPLIES